MELTEVERLLLANQYEILSRLAEDDGERNSFNNLNKIYSKGYTSFYDYHEQIDDELTEDDCKFVIDVIDMYDWFYHSYNRFTDDEKEIIPYSDMKFPGFDLNDSTEVRFLSFAEFILRDQDKFSGFIEKSTREKKLNSHGSGPGIVGYKKMLSVFSEIKYQAEPLTLEQTKEVLNSMYLTPKY